MASELLKELAPLLADEGINVDDIDVPDMATLQAAFDRAVERRNMQQFTPAGQPREYAVCVLRLVAVCVGDTALAGGILDGVQPESPDGTAATVAGCIGVGLGLLDDWLSGRNEQAPSDLARVSDDLAFSVPGRRVS